MAFRLPSPRKTHASDVAVADAVEYGDGNSGSVLAEGERTPSHERLRPLREGAGVAHPFGLGEASGNSLQFMDLPFLGVDGERSFRTTAMPPICSVEGDVRLIGTSAHPAGSE